MRKLKNYTEYIKEEFIESGNLNSKLQAFREGKKKSIIEWFSKGMFNNAVLADIQITHGTSNLAKDLILEFNDNQFYYQVIFSVSINDYKDGKFDKANLKVKKYGLDIDNTANSLKGNLIDQWNSDNPDAEGAKDGQIKITDFKPEFILDIISKMESESQAFGTQETEEVQDIQGQNQPNFEEGEF